jgi:hypothetical protein
MRKDCLHGGLLGLESEIPRLNSGTEAQIGLVGKRGLLVV